MGGKNDIPQSYKDKLKEEQAKIFFQKRKEEAIKKAIKQEK